MTKEAGSKPKRKRKHVPNNGAKTSPEAIMNRQRIAKALELRLEGASFAQIAGECGWSNHKRAHEAVSKALKEITREAAEDVRTMELERLDRMFGVHYLNAQAGDVDAVGAAMRIMDRRAKLLGIDLPKAPDDDAPAPVSVIVQVQDARVRNADAEPAAG